ncbi:bagremycin/ferroverdin biosynthesis copper chaperon BagZ/FevE [Streptomyces sp. BB1-1-1]|uniref:bagremycin/ferroverdin biosynthesis copper chaperon BagZ/FevE n=1 Tax=unclassified Streptomyces TaxID=2593676 RepID=UPI002877BE6E|nr:bagremycin/ferroverdin biosynthesis copper chaperon BagZ/FevE [Streptomyces sp. BB1-1-1]WND37035.1 bagremycin/ferroverdin biosynthesis copper chaperon BagZ/FevE [Streptomyces sp. BB1-1-1]
MKRRDVMKGMAGAVAVAAAPAAVIHAGNTWAASNEDAAAPGAAGEESGDLYTEQYKGRTITVTKSTEKVRIDGRELHLMKLGEGAYLSSMCHYRFEATPLAAGRQAVDELRGANLLPSGGHHHA